MTQFIRPNLNILGSVATVRLYWISTGLFTLLFVVLILLTLGDLKGSYENYLHLGFLTWSVFFNATGKILGLLAIYHNKSRTLKDFAFAGFLFELLLALCSHIAQREIDVLRAIFGLMLWCFAFTMNRRVFPVQDDVQASQLNAQSYS